MSSKRFNSLPNDTKAIPADVIEKLISIVKKNCTTKFDESIDLNLQINNKQKKNEINLRTIVNLPAGTGKKIKVKMPFHLEVRGILQRSFMFSLNIDIFSHKQQNTKSIKSQWLEIE